MLGGLTTLSLPGGTVPVNASGQAVLTEDLLHGLVLPGVITAYKNNGQVSTLSLNHFIQAQYQGGGNFGAARYLSLSRN